MNKTVLNIITPAVIIRWLLTGCLIFIALFYKPFLIVIAIVASIFCEVYWYLWQRERLGERCQI